MDMSTFFSFWNLYFLSLFDHFPIEISTFSSLTYWNLYFLFTFLFIYYINLYFLCTFLLKSLVSVTFWSFFHWNLYFLSLSYWNLYFLLLSDHFPIEISPFSSLSCWNLYFLVTFPLKSLLPLHFSIEISSAPQWKPSLACPKTTAPTRKPAMAFPDNTATRWKPLMAFPNNTAPRWKPSIAFLIRIQKACAIDPPNCQIRPTLKKYHKKMHKRTQTEHIQIAYRTQIRRKRNAKQSTCSAQKNQIWTQIDFRDFCVDAKIMSYFRKIKYFFLATQKIANKTQTKHSVRHKTFTKQVCDRSRRDTIYFVLWSCLCLCFFARSKK